MILTNESKVFIGIPSTGQWHAKFGMSLIATLDDFHSGRPCKGYDRNIAMPFSRITSCLTNARNDMVKFAYESGCNRLLFLDSDQTFPPDTIRRLVNRDKDIVAANIATKMFPSNPTARGFDKKPVYTTSEKRGLEKVWRVGTGIMMIRLNSVKLAKLPMPWFTHQWEPELGSFEGEDWGFVRQAEAVGVETYIDHDLSREVGHIGYHTYMLSDPPPES